MRHVSVLTRLLRQKLMCTATLNGALMEITGRDSFKGAYILVYSVITQR